MPRIGVRDAKNQLSRLLRRVEQGQEVVILRRKTPVAKLVPYDSPTRARGFGSMRGRASVGPEFFHSLPEDELTRWEGG